MKRAYQNNTITRRHFLNNLTAFSAATCFVNSFISCSQGKNSASDMSGLVCPGFQDITISGDLLLRALRNYDRLHDPLFQYDNIAKHTLNDPYPGDFLGRTVLGLAQLAQVLGKEPLYLEEIIQRLPHELVNEKGYTGKVLNKGFYDEIQITGHQFFLRGLCEYYIWKKDDTIRSIIESTVVNMMMPLAQDIDSYPLLEKRDNLKKGGAVAMDAGLVENWQLSTDTCQLFMILDGLTQVYELFPSQELKEAIENIIQFYTRIDFLQIKAQTHAMLSSLRGILRFYEIEGGHDYLTFVENNFEIYKKHAWTENYENYNWFGRPTHTEGCAVIDSFLLAVELWKVTGQSRYLQDAHLIYYNGVLHNQWTNGGFGVNSCVGPDKNIFLTHKVEATWCCTMRGSEGLARAARYSYFYDNDNIYIPFYHDNQVTLKLDEGDLSLKLSGSYPFEGKIQIQVLNSDLKSRKQFHFFIPEWIDTQSIKVFYNGKDIQYKLKDGFVSFLTEIRKKDVFELNFDIRFYKKELFHKDVLPEYSRYFHGPLLLGCKSHVEIEMDKNSKFFPINGNRAYKSQNDHILAPLNTLDFENVEDQKKASFQFLFRGLLMLG